MVFINYDLKAIYIHNVKCGGCYVRTILNKYYNFNEITNNLHNNYENFFDNINDINYNYDTDKHTIRKFGKIRYFLSHQDIDSKIFEDFFTFTFVRNPYEKIISAYYYLKRILNESGNIKTRNTKENPDYFINFNTFIKNYNLVNNISYYHAFITQYEQLLNYNGKINISYIGKLDNLDNDLINILSILNIKDIKHINEIYNSVKYNKSEKNINIANEYDEESFLFVNNFFKKDFETFNFEKYKTYEEFQNRYLLPSNESSKNSEILQIYYPKEIFSYVDNYKNICIIFHNILLKDEIIEKYKTIFDTILNLLENTANNYIIKREINNIKNTFNELIKIEILEKNKNFDFIKNNFFCLNYEYLKNDFFICKKCSYKSFNILSKIVHNYLC